MTADDDISQSNHGCGVFVSAFWEAGNENIFVVAICECIPDARPDSFPSDVGLRKALQRGEDDVDDIVTHSRIPIHT